MPGSAWNEISDVDRGTLYKFLKMKKGSHEFCTTEDKCLYINPTVFCHESQVQAFIF